MISDEAKDRTKKCSKCGIEKPLDNFHRNSYKKDGLQTYCKFCVNSRRDYIPRVRSMIVVGDIKICTTCGKGKKLSEFYIDNKGNEGLRSECKTCIRIKVISRFKLVSPGKRRERNSKRTKNTNSVPSLKLRKNIRDLLRSTLKYKGIRKSKSTFLYTGIPIEEYCNYFMSDPLWTEYENKTQKIHIDHIIPCSAYDFADPDEIKKCWNPRNLRFLSVKENVIKSDKFIPELIDQYGIQDLLPKKLLTSYLEYAK